MNPYPDPNNPYPWPTETGIPDTTTFGGPSAVTLSHLHTALQAPETWLLILALILLIVAGIWIYKNRRQHDPR